MFKDIARFFRKKKVPVHHIRSMDWSDPNHVFGFELGARLQKQIKEILELSQAYRFRDSAKMELAAEAFANCPEVQEEIWGIADGAEVDLEDIIALNFFEDELWEQPAEHCSLVFFRNQNGAIVGWNEDGNPNYAGRMSLIRAKLPDTEFVTLNYPGLLCGDTLAVTSHGLVIALQSLYPVVTQHDLYLPRSFVGRMVLEAKDIREVSRVLADLCSEGVKDGIHVFAHEIKSGSSLSAEIHPESSSVFYLPTNQTIRKMQSFFAHTNHYFADLSKTGLSQANYPSSKARLGYLRNFDTLKSPSPEVVAEILSNRPPNREKVFSSDEYSICRKGEGSSVTTLHSQVLYLEKGKRPVLWTSPGNPADCRFRDWQKQEIDFV